MKTRVIVPPVPRITRYALSGVFIAVSGASLFLAAWITPEIEGPR